MMRVTRIPTSGQRPTLRVEGHLNEQTVEELRMECETALGEYGALDLDLSGLQFADAAGVSLLQRLERDGARLDGRSAFVGELLGSGDAALVAELRAGDPQAFETLVRQYGGRMLAVARRMMLVEEDARDVVQEAFLSAFRSIRSFEGSARISTWLHRIVVNAALMKMRSRRRRREEPIDDLLPRFDEEGHFAEPAASWDTESTALLERQQTRIAVRRAIDRLPESYRTVLILRDIEELDTEETAERLGMTPNAVKTRLHRARQALRTLIEREMGDRNAPASTDSSRAGRVA
jgi:RNA polymerase sigma-70 factor (ECF subfamily)